MTEHEVSRTLVKSPPELWAECSDTNALSRHLNESFGEIRITRLEPETAVAWEGERASGTVRLEPAGWGTKVVMTATAVDDLPEVPLAEVAVDHERASEPSGDDEPVAEEPVAPPPTVGPTVTAVRRRRFGRLFGFFRGPDRPVEPPEPPAGPEAAVAPDKPEAPLEPPPEPPEYEEPGATTPISPQEALTAALDSLGQAHHRPYSRA
jgi:hypothetical protein